MFPNKHRRISFTLPPEECDVTLEFPELEPTTVVELNFLPAEISFEWIVPGTHPVEEVEESDDNDEVPEISDAENERNLQKLREVARSLETLAKELEEEDQVVPQGPQVKRRRIDEPSTSTAQVMPRAESSNLNEMVFEEIDRMTFLRRLEEEADQELFVDGRIDEPSTSTAQVMPFNLDEMVSEEDRMNFLLRLKEEAEQEPFVDEEIVRLLARARRASSASRYDRCFIPISAADDSDDSS